MSQSYQGAEIAGILSGMNKEAIPNMNREGPNIRLEQSKSQIAQHMNIMSSIPNAQGA